MFPTGSDGKRYLSKAGRQYRKNVYADVLEQLGIFMPFKAPLIATVGMYIPDNRKRDLDNTFKALFDSLKYSNVFFDDDQITGILAFKLPRVDKGKCLVSIEPADQWCANREYRSLEQAFMTI